MQPEAALQHRAQITVSYMGCEMHQEFGGKVEGAQGVAGSQSLLMQGEAFGCPYKTASPQELTEMLRAMRLPPRAVEEAVSKARGHHYQLACTAAFQGQHSCICESGISHPNQV